MDISSKGMHKWLISRCKDVNLLGRWEILIKTMIKFCFSPIRMATIKKIDNKSFGEDVEQLKPSNIIGKKEK